MAGSPRDAEVGQGRADTSQLSPHPLFPQRLELWGRGGGGTPQPPRHVPLTLPCPSPVQKTPGQPGSVPARRQEFGEPTLLAFFSRDSEFLLHAGRAGGRKGGEGLYLSSQAGLESTEKTSTSLRLQQA